MEKQKLAHELRQRQIKFGYHSEDVINALTDDGIIDAYVTCSGCGAKYINEPELEHAIFQSNNADAFIAICGSNHNHME